MSEIKLQPHQERVVTEKRELDDKIEKLLEFIDSSPHFAGLSNAEQERLVRQAQVMEEYSLILRDRIAAF